MKTILVKDLKPEIKIIFGGKIWTVKKVFPYGSSYHSLCVTFKEDLNEDTFVLDKLLQYNLVGDNSNFYLLNSMLNYYDICVNSLTISMPKNRSYKQKIKILNAIEDCAKASAEIREFVKSIESELTPMGGGI